MACSFSLWELDTETREQKGLRCAHPHFGPVPGPLQQRKREKGRVLRACVDVCVWGGKHSPGRIPGPRRRAGFSRWRRGCVPGSQLAARIYTTNGAPTVSRALTHACTHMSGSTQRSSAHADARSERRGERERKREWASEQEASYLLEWYSANTNSSAVSETRAEPRWAQSNNISTAE